jgi:hypothetical protein
MKYIPFIYDMGAIGPFVFAGIILLSFLILGFIYDRVLVMWAPSQEVSFERNPFQYVPSPKERVFWFPIYSALLDGLEELANNHNLDPTKVKETREYYSEIQKLKPERNKDLDRGIELRKEFVRTHRFSDILDEEKEP